MPRRCLLACRDPWKEPGTGQERYTSGAEEIALSKLDPTCHNQSKPVKPISQVP
jgi:hypothetical protein